MTAEVRRATSADIAEVMRLAEYMYASVGASVDDRWRTMGADELSARLDTDLLGWVVDAQVQGELAACGLVNVVRRLPLPSARSTVMGYVQWVATDPRYQRRGLASSIMRAVGDWAMGAEVDVLSLHASPTARPLYLALGYTFAHPVDFPADMLGAPMQWRVPWPDAGSPRDLEHS